MITSETFVQKPTNLVFNNPSFKDHEQIVFCQDEETGLKAIIGIHSTTLGPAGWLVRPAISAVRFKASSKARHTPAILVKAAGRCCEA